MRRVARPSAGGQWRIGFIFDRLRSCSIEFVRRKNTRTRLGAMPAWELNSVRIVDPVAADDDGNEAAA
jgi:hypothetical protein